MDGINVLAIAGLAVPISVIVTCTAVAYCDIQKSIITKCQHASIVVELRLIDSYYLTARIHIYNIRVILINRPFGDNTLMIEIYTGR